MQKRRPSPCGTYLEGQGLRNYMPNSQRDILAAVMDCYEEAYRAGAALALKHNPQDTPPTYNLSPVE
ncbi:MAG: hypothetical protein IPM41_16150 [Sphingomonadales bacterium]|nr:hypothetical protein [Sphingomonadales bacterium]